MLNKKEANELLKFMGKNIIDCKKPSSGQTAKIANNLALAIQMQSIIEAMMYADKMGLDLNILNKIMGTATSRFFKKLLEFKCRQPSSWISSFLSFKQ